MNRKFFLNLFTNNKHQFKIQKYFFLNRVHEHDSTYLSKKQINNYQLNYISHGYICLLTDFTHKLNSTNNTWCILDNLGLPIKYYWYGYLYCFKLVNEAREVAP